MKQQNVVPFEPFSRDGMARRGAPDKTRARESETIEVECPSCSAVLCLEAGILSMGPEVLCVGCDTTIPPKRSDAARCAPASPGGSILSERAAGGNRYRPRITERDRFLVEKLHRQ